MSEFSDSELSRILEENKFRANLKEADLSGSNLSSAKLFLANLSKANLREANMRKAYLREANMREANMKKANLRKADLRRADLRDTNMNESDLSGADLEYANLECADLSDANLRGTDLLGANLRGANLMRVRGLTIEQLSSVGTLCDAELSSERMEQVRKKYPHLLEEIGLDEEELSKPKIITLRTSYKKLSLSEVRSMPNVSIRDKTRWGLTAQSSVNHDYNIKTIKGNKVVVDNATGLMWHQSGSDDRVKWREAKDWIEDLNSEGCAGYHDWRLPTVDEAVSLLESSEKNGDLYIDPVFSKKQNWIWTGNRKSGGSEDAWRVNFGSGRVDGWYVGYSCYVRPVRSMR
jgi:hypothetical protein